MAIGRPSCLRWPALATSGTAARLILALMRQDMSAFGSKSGEADLNWRKPEASRPTDFFA
jgi:hypothetical protein